MTTTDTSPATATTTRRSAFSRELRHEIEIDAPAENVWQALINTADYGWNPFIHRIEGRLTVGAKLQVEIEPPGGRVMKFKPTVLEVEPASKLRWIGHFLMPRVLDGEHTFELQPLDGRPHPVHPVGTLQRHPRRAPRPNARQDRARLRRDERRTEERGRERRSMTAMDCCAGTGEHTRPVLSPELPVDRGHVGVAIADRRFDGCEARELARG